MSLLKEGDVIRLAKGTKVYCYIPEHYVYSNRRGVFDKLTRGEYELDQDGRFIVVKTALDGGGSGQGGDYYPDGHHVWCEDADQPAFKIDFYQTGCYPIAEENIHLIGKAERKWEVARG